MNTTARNLAVPILLIILLGLLIYANSLPGPFLWDDDFLVKNNPRITSRSNFLSLFTENIASHSLDSPFYRPAQMATYMLDYSFWRLNPLGYHLTNIFIHILVGLSLYALVLTLFGDRALACLASLLFVAHPVHTEAVSYISGRADILVALFILISLVTYVRFLEGRNWIFYAASLLACALALLSKEYGVILPVLLGVYHAAFSKKVSVKTFWPFVALPILYLIYRYVTMDTEGQIIPHMHERLPGALIAFTEYLRLLVFPFHLHMAYGQELFSILDPRAWAGLALFLGMVSCAIVARRRSRLVNFSILWYLAALLPVLNIFPVNAYMAEHWLYVPSMGLGVLCAKGFLKLNRPGVTRFAFRTSVFALLIYFSVLTIFQNRTWNDAQAFYEHSLKYIPDSTFNMNLGLIYYRQGRGEEAVELFKKAIELDPSNAKAYSNLGNAYRAQKRLEEALALQKKAVELKPGEPSYYNNMGTVLMDMARYAESEGAFRKALSIDAGYAEALNNLGLLFYAQERLDEAQPYFLKAIELRPGYAEPHFTLALIHYRRGEWARAIEYCDQARALGYEDEAFSKALEPFRNRN